MFEPGIYEVISDVKIRREPRIIEAYRNGELITNQVGILRPGTRREIYSIVTNKDNTTWGRVSESDAAGIAEWVCIKGLNRSYLKFYKSTDPGIEARLAALEARVTALEKGKAV